jgi:hypothetical protein
MTVNQETRRSHYIWHLRLYYNFPSQIRQGDRHIPLWKQNALKREGMMLNHAKVADRKD